MKNYRYWNKKIINSLSKLLKEGLTPKKLSLVITIGITVSIFPVIGTTTLICTLIAFLFNLNLPAIQLANYAGFPLQITLFFPFLKIGEIISTVSLEPISKTQLLSTFNEGIFYAIQSLSNYLIIACLGWLLLIIPIFIFLYILIIFVLRKYKPLLLKLDISQ
jgi:uncharacterized protein (DUF2062 family)